jgi:hypothetical protein
MKSTERFKTIIETKLKEMATEDPLFAKKLSNPEKNIDDCITYILNTVKKSGSNGFADDEIFGMAAHYYDEVGIDVGEEIDCQVVVNYKPELTEEEIAEAKKKALDQIVIDEKKRLLHRQMKKAKSQKLTQQSLF